MEFYEKDIYEILGISTREDSYTNLIKYLFDNWTDLKLKFVKKLAQDIKGDFNLATRNTYNLSEDERSKIIPDMTLYSKNEILSVNISSISTIE